MAQNKNDPDAAVRKQRQAEDGRKAMSEYEAAAVATREKTARLRALRMAREAEDLKSGVPSPAKTGASRSKARSGTSKSGSGRPKGKAPPKLAQWLEDQKKDGR